MGLFKNTAVFSKYVSPLTGSDNNAGTIASPYSTITKAQSIVYNSPILINGKTTENINMRSSNLVGDGEFAELAGQTTLKLQNGDEANILSNLKITSLSVVSPNLTNCKIGTLATSLAGFMDTVIVNCFIETINGRILASYQTTGKNNTLINFNNYLDNSTRRYISNSIIVSIVDLYNYTSRNYVNNIPLFSYCLFRKSTVWKWNGVTIPINYGTYGNTAGDYMADVISGLYAYANALAAGTDKNYFLAMIPSAASSNIFYVDANGQTCKVVEDRPSVTGSHQIFNRYVNDAPVDYSLFLDKDNVALTMSDQLSYVGCYKANADVLTFGAVVNVNADGTDDLATTPDMLIADGNGKFHASSADSVQIRNRVRSNVFTFKRGFSLVGFQSQMKSGLNSRFSLGKFQPYNITDAPTLPQESIEVIPYDDAVIPSAFPRFSAMFNDKVQMWYHTAGAKVGLPVLFNDLLADFAIVTDKSLAEYGAWAVTNADYETFTLSTKANVKLQNVPVYFAKVEINLNYHV